MNSKLSWKKKIIYVIFFYTIVPHEYRALFTNDTANLFAIHWKLCLALIYLRKKKRMWKFVYFSKQNQSESFQIYWNPTHEINSNCSSVHHTTGRTEDLCHAIKSAFYPIINNIIYLILDNNSDDPIMETAFTFILLYVKSSISIRNRSHGIDKFIAPIWMNQISDKMHSHLGTHILWIGYNLFETPFVHFIAELFYYFNSYDIYGIVFYPKCLMILNFSNGDQYLKRILYYYYYYCRIVNSSPAYFIFFFKKKGKFIFNCLTIIIVPCRKFFLIEKKEQYWTCSCFKKSEFQEYISMYL